MIGRVRRLLRWHAQSSSAFVRLHAVEDLSYPMSLLFRQTGVVFPVVLYLFVARLFEIEAGGSSAAVGDYYSYMVVGVSVAALLQITLSGFGVQLQYAQDQGTFETVLTEPISWGFIPVAMNLWRMVIGIVSAATMLGIGVLLGAELRMSGIPYFVLIALVGMLATMAVGVLAASLMVLAKRAAPVLTLYGLLASLVAGTLFPIELMPWWLRWVSFIVPHTYVIDLARGALMIDNATALEPSTALASLAAFTAVTWTVAALVFSRALQYARRMGLLSGY